TLSRWQDLFPFIPALPLGIRQLPNPFPDRPWSALGDIFVGCPPWMFGMAYLVPLDVLFSSWFCYWIWRLLPVVAMAWGHEDRQDLHLFETSFGAYVGLGLSAL